MKIIRFALLAAAVVLASCNEDDSTPIPRPEKTVIADLVVYGKIYTAEENNPWVTGIAIKDGKYLYVGDMSVAEQFVYLNKTKVLHQTEGIIFPSCIDAHGHYITEAVFKQLLYLNPEDSYDAQIAAIKKYYLANEGKIKQLFGFGWSVNNMEESELLKVREALDAITTEIPVFISDCEMMQGWVNSKALEDAGITLNAPGQPDRDESAVKGGTVFRHNGKATGRVQNQACSYVRFKAFKEPIASLEQYSKAVENAEAKLLSMGYSTYLDAWLNFDNTDDAYKAISSRDKDNLLKINVVGCYGIDSYRVSNAAEYKKLADEALDWKNKYSTKHFHPDCVKLFADGLAEDFTGYVSEPYPYTGGCGVSFWDNAGLFNDMVRYVNDKSMPVHTHTYGDAAAQYVLDAYELSYRAGNHIRNGLEHVGNITDDDLDRAAQFGVSVAENFNRHAPGVLLSQDEMVALYGQKYLSMYPMKRFFTHRVTVASASDFPCGAGCPSYPFAIMEMMLTGINPYDPQSQEYVVGADDLLDIGQAMEAMTINGAKALGLEAERGSIKAGKYADFLILNHDLTGIEPSLLHTIEILDVYYEGKKIL